MSGQAPDSPDASRPGKVRGRLTDPEPGVERGALTRDDGSDVPVGRLSPIGRWKSL